MKEDVRFDDFLVMFSAEEHQNRVCFKVYPVIDWNLSLIHISTTQRCTAKKFELWVKEDTISSPFLSIGQKGMFARLATRDGLSRQ